MQMKKEDKILQRLIIKKSRFRFTDLLYLGAFLFSIYLVVQAGKITLSLILFVALTGFIVLKLIQRLKDDTLQIVIDENGITLNCNDNKLIKWNNIKFAYIKQTIVGIGKNSRVIDWFHIETISEEYTIKMSDFSFDSSQLTQCINYFSEREIGHISNKLSYKGSSMTKDKELANKMYAVFNSNYKRERNLGLIVLFGLLAIVIFLQIKINFPYVFAIGWTFIILVLGVWGVYNDKKLRNHELFKDLDDETYKNIINEYGEEFNYKSSKRQTITVVVFLFVSILIAFGVSYMLQ